MIINSSIIIFLGSSRGALLSFGSSRNSSGGNPKILILVSAILCAGCYTCRLCAASLLSTPPCANIILAVYLHSLRLTLGSGAASFSPFPSVAGRSSPILLSASNVASAGRKINTKRESFTTSSAGPLVQIIHTGA